jgi:alanyl-tRNA synthetase
MSTFGKPIAGADLRARFLASFEKQGHHVAASSPLVPQGDATLLFTNAGMVQFKDVFTGREVRPYKRAASSQKCVRAGGKHNDLENVGRTARHHTFFEMLGNFSFGDYFKAEAIEYAWTFLTRDLGIPVDRLSVTVFEGDAQTPADVEAEELWKKIGVPASKISRHGAKDNFWQMGDTGPCGPCTEIHFDRGVVKGAFGGDDPEGDRVLEIWNLVFMQFERQADKSLVPLPRPSVDTGMGLERLAMVMNGVASNYDTDLLRPLITFSEEKLGKKYTSSDGIDDVAMRVIADHARTTAFLVADGVLPGNLNREYVLRSIMRRAIRFGEQLGFKDLFFHEVAGRVVEMFGKQYPELTNAKALIEKVVTNEEEAFRRTLKKGLELYGEHTKTLAKGAVIPGPVVFDLKATHGFPPDMTAQMAREQGLEIDWDGFKKAEERHAEASAGDLGVAGTADVFKVLRSELGATTFVGYEAQDADAKVIAILKKNQRVSELQKDEQGFVLLDKTPFYGESGGQVGDAGTLTGTGVRVSVDDTKKQAELHLHSAYVNEGTLKVGDVVRAHVNTDVLERTRRNHSATHLLHYALRKVLGDHVTQKGSLVAPDRLRFDFSHFEAMTPAQIQQVEDIVNELILNNVAGDIENMSFDDARKKGAMALFGEKYGDRVRVIAFGPSVELCGGIHVRRTGDIGLFKITSEGPLASGVRRIEAVTGKGAIELVRRQQALLVESARALKVSVDELPIRIERLQESLRNAEKEIEKSRQKAQAQAAGNAVGNAVDVKGIKVLAQKVVDIDPKNLRDYADKLRDQLKSGVVVLGAPVSDADVRVLVALTPDLVGKLNAGAMLKELVAVVGGKGGGKPDFAQGGGTIPGKLDDALTLARDIVART